MRSRLTIMRSLLQLYGGDGHASVDDVPDGRVQDWDGYILGVPALYHGLDSKQGEGLQGALERAHKEYRPSYREHIYH